MRYEIIDDQEVAVSGSITVQREHWHAIVRWRIGNRPWESKWQALRLSERGNKKKANDMLSELIDKRVDEIRMQIYRENGINPEYHDMLYGDYLKTWVLLQESKLQPSTYQNYVRVIKNIIAPFFDKKRLRLCDLRKSDIDKFYGERMLKGNCANTIHRYHAVVLKSLSYAKKVKAIKENPAEKYELPKVQRHISTYLNASDMKMVLEATKDTPLEIPIMFAAYYGLRRSEILGIKWNRIDFETKTISILGKVVEIYGEPGKRKLDYSDEMKTESSRRVLPLIPQVEEALLRHKEKIFENKNFFGNAYVPKYKDFVCVHENGDLIHPNYITIGFKKFVRKLPIDHSVTLHGLRHSCATLLLSMGFSLKEIQLWLGHSSFQVTADIYTHVDMSSKVIMGDKVGQALSL